MARAAAPTSPAVVIIVRFNCYENKTKNENRKQLIRLCVSRNSTELISTAGIENTKNENRKQLIRLCVKRKRKQNSKFHRTNFDRWDPAPTTTTPAPCVPMTPAMGSLRERSRSPRQKAEAASKPCNVYPPAPFTPVRRLQAARAPQAYLRFLPLI